MGRERLGEAATGLFWFAIGGVIGFLVDVGVLYVLKGAMGLYAARGLSFFCAAFSTWLFNRAVTFRGRRSGHSRAREFGLYLALMTIGGSVNYGLFALLVSRVELVVLYPAVGVAAGSLAGMAVNLLTSRFLLFRHRHS